MVVLGAPQDPVRVEAAPDADAEVEGDARATRRIGRHLVFAFAPPEDRGLARAGVQREVAGKHHVGVDRGRARPSE